MRNVLLALVLLTTPALAQSSQGRGEIAGTVYDSITRRPLSRATVQAVSVAATAAPPVSAETDDRGRFVISGLAPGRYLVGFHHPVLDSLALDAPTLVVDVAAAARAPAHLAVPPAARIVASVCQTGTADSTGLIIGLVRDAGTGTPRAASRVEARWTDIVIDASGINTQRRDAAATASEEGWFGLCLPYGTDVLISATSGADSSGFQLVEVPANGLARRDLFLGGTATVQGIVRNDRELPLAGARVGFAGTGREVTADSTGAFRLVGPAGSQTLEARALGYAADRRYLVLGAAADTTIPIRLTRLDRVLDTVRVVAERLYDLDAHGFETRRKTGIGRFWDRDDMRRGRYISIYDALRTSPSVTIEQTGFERTLLVRGGLGGRCAPLVFLNDIRLDPSAASQLDLLAHPDEIAGMELYSVAQVPPQYGGTAEGCGVVVLWTRAPQRRRP